MPTPCTPIYKGKDLKFEDFISMLHDGELDKLIADGHITNKKVIDGWSKVKETKDSTNNKPKLTNDEKTNLTKKGNEKASDEGLLNQTEAIPSTDSKVGDVSKDTQSGTNPTDVVESVPEKVEDNTVAANDVVDKKVAELESKGETEANKKEVGVSEVLPIEKDVENTTKKQDAAKRIKEALDTILSGADNSPKLLDVNEGMSRRDKNKGMKDALLKLIDAIGDYTKESFKEVRDSFFDRIKKDYNLDFDEKTQNRLVNDAYRDAALNKKKADIVAEGSEPVVTSIKRAAIKERLGDISKLSANEVQDKVHSMFPDREKDAYKDALTERNDNPIEFYKEVEGIVSHIFDKSGDEKKQLAKLAVYNTDLVIEEKNIERNIQKKLNEGDLKEVDNLQKDLITNRDNQVKILIAAGAKGTEASDVFNFLKELHADSYSYANMKERRKAILGVVGDLSPKQEAELKEDYDKVKKTTDAVAEALKEENEKLKNKNEFLEDAIKKAGDRIVKERKNDKNLSREAKIEKSKQREENIWKKLKALRGQLNDVTSIPALGFKFGKYIGEILSEKIYRKMHEHELTVDDIMKKISVKEYVDEIHDDLVKNGFPDITKDEINKYVSGEFNKKSDKVRSEHSKAVSLLKAEAKAINDFNDLVNGKIKDYNTKTKTARSEATKRVLENYNEFSKEQQNKKDIKELGLDNIDHLSQKEISDIIKYNKTQITRIDTDLKNKREKLKTMEETGELVPKKEATQYTQGEKLKNKIQEDKMVKCELTKNEKDIIYAKLPRGERNLKLAVDLIRASLLLFPKTLLKIGGMLAWATVNKPIEMTANRLIHFLSKNKVSEKADVFGKPTLKDLGTFYKTFFKHFGTKYHREWNNIYAIYGGEQYFNYLPKGLKWMSVGGHIHQYMKSYLAHSEFNVARDKIMDRYIREGRELELGDTQTIEFIEKQAFDHSMYSILFNDNKIMRIWRDIINSVSKNVSPHASVLTKTQAPILRVPINYIARTLTYNFGGHKGIFGQPEWSGSKHSGLIELSRMVESNITPEQSNWVYKNLSKGSVGLVYTIVGGWILRDLLDDLTDKYTSDLPHKVQPYVKTLFHSPFLETSVNIAAQFSKAEYDMRKTGVKCTTLDYAQRILDTQIDLIKNAPLLNETPIGYLFNTFSRLNNNGKWEKMGTEITDYVVNLLTPGFIRELAAFTVIDEMPKNLSKNEAEQWLRENKGNRTPKTPLEVLYKALPFMVNKIPTNIERYIDKKKQELLTPISNEEFLAKYLFSLTDKKWYYEFGGVSKAKPSKSSSEQEEDKPQKSAKFEPEPKDKSE